MIKGSITVFFSLVFVTIVSVLGATLESARWAGARLYLRQAADIGIRSVFADYYRPLFEDYGVLFLDETYSEGHIMTEEKLEEYLLYNLNPNYGNFLKSPFLYKGNVSEITIQDKVLAIDGRGAVFRKSACDYMKYRIPADLAEHFLEQLDFINQAEVISDFFSQIQGIRDDLSRIDETVLKINGFVEEIRQLQVLVDNICTEVTELLAIENPDEKTKKLLEDRKKTLLDTKQSIVERVEEILEKTGIYTAVSKKVVGFLEDLSDEWLSKTGIPQNIRDIVFGEIESLIMYSGGTGDIYGIEKNGSFLESILGTLENWVTEYTSGSLDVLDGIGVTVELPDLPSEIIKNFNAEALWKEFSSNSFYSLMCPDYSSLSEAQIKPFDNRAYVWERAETYSEEESFVGEVAEDIVFQEYIGQMFASYTNQDDSTSIKYETEYIIAGKYTDKDNVDAIINRLLAVREGLNLAYIMTDSQKRNEAHALAMSCLGFTGIYVGVKALEYAILAVWAFGEAMIDVRILMSGGSVPVVKGAGDWKIDLEGLLHMGEILSSAEGNGVRGGLGDWYYGDYLKLFLYMQNKDDQVLRVMDLVEANLKKNYSTAFHITNCVQKLNMKAGFESPAIFGNNYIFNRKCEISFGCSY
ncbi:MAG: hypothetical protein E7261_05275 [Lachnospiraceae bacterium]|nr:hypothetical protein [Lachnospiraceae bacterium]